MFVVVVPSNNRGRRFNSLLDFNLFKLFNEHPKGILNPKEIEDLTTFMTNFWFEIEQSDLSDRYPWTKDIHNLFKIELSSYWPVRYSMKSFLYRDSWRFFNAWVDKYEKEKEFKTLQERTALNEIMNKIIYFSDYETFAESVKNNHRINKSSKS
jgi:hypothetical protein